MSSFKHISVLQSESIEGLNIKQSGVYIDATAGGGGHSYEIAKRLNGGRLFCFDRDPEAVEACKERLKGFSGITVINSRFSNLKAELSAHSVSNIDGALFDLGVSSHQLDTADRGFSYHNDAPLDMRMSKQGISAKEIVNTYSAEELAKIFFEYADEKFSFKIAKEIAKERQESPIETTLQLSEIVKRCYPQKFKRNKHPAKKVFQALRMAVNDEIGEIKTAIDDAFSLLNTGGRLVVITFHSIEDRLIKQKFAEYTRGCTCPPDFPVCVCQKQPRAKLVNRKPVLPGEEELKANLRSHSAKLRVLEKL